MAWYKEKIIFIVLDLENNANKIIIIQKRGQLIYLLSKNWEVRLWHCHFTYISSVWIIQASNLVDGIKLSNIAIDNFNDNPFSLDLEANDEKEIKPDIDIYITLTPASLNKIMESIKDFCDTYIKSKYIKIIKYKKITPIVWKLEEIHANL